MQYLSAVLNFRKERHTLCIREVRCPVQMSSWASIRAEPIRAELRVERLPSVLLLQEVQQAWAEAWVEAWVAEATWVGNNNCLHPESYGTALSVNPTTQLQKRRQSFGMWQRFIPYAMELPRT